MTQVLETNKVSNDPIADFLTRVRNALLVNKKTVLVPFSRVKKELAELLKREGYITSVAIVGEDKVSTKSLEIGLKYNVARESVIKGLRKVSKSGLRKYSKSKYAPRVLNGLGISILTTNKGLKTDREARKENIGGELLCQIW